MIKADILQSFSTNNTKLRDSLADYSNGIINDKFQNDLNLTTKQQSQINTKIEHDNDDNNNENNDNDHDDNISQLRKRLLKGQTNSQNSELNFDQSLQIEESKQEDILKDMFQFINSIKEGAHAFNDKLNQDSNVLKAAETGLDVTSKKLINSKKNLSKTINSLGLIDALKIFVIVILLFLLSLIIIKIFPKW
ncbi:hypothetical protein BN7_1612 [Wickerhamomyces ciferrii]|uniref:Uncharacterized protein n=1 Tax=Wickerhamomyces ciferrii (strain ATCC 14091 / BCRC 22168 / CBS 111 / JCM 3599 / NBRC 0793 / NRRL Y-1031 F-60-10) TaxID=1206466 RepID=K0KLR8_WICCF|nr:uncharacterized protein BN7_1612 [Wickerhamomyces ciferrii]CCH42073.1 hypothetical protein BN7_1612 [Wickerhamomyces ciferrii]